MSLQTIEFDLQITPGSIPPVLHLAQYDSGRKFYANLKNGSAAFYPTAGSTAKIKGFNAAGVAWEQEATIFNNTVSFTPAGAATDQFGVMPVTIEIAYDGEVLTPLLVVFDIQRAGYTNEEAVRSPEFAEAMEEAAAEAVGDAVVWRANQAAKTDAMTNPIGIDEDGKLWAEPGSGGSSNAVQYVAQSLTTSQKAQARTNIGAYSKPSDGIPGTDMTAAVQAALAAAVPTVVTLTGSTPVIAEAQDNTIYEAGELTSLTIQSIATGASFIVRFSSPAGTATALTMPSGVYMPSGFTVEAYGRCEINVAGNYAAAMFWPFDT